MPLYLPSEFTAVWNMTLRSHVNWHNGDHGLAVIADREKLCPATTCESVLTTVRFFRDWKNILSLPIHTV